MTSNRSGISKNWRWIHAFFISLKLVRYKSTGCWGGGGIGRGHYKDDITAESEMAIYGILRYIRHIIIKSGYR